MGQMPGTFIVGEVYDAVMRYYVHHTPGRLRIKIPILKDNAEKGERTGKLLQSLTGVNQVTVNARTGSVLIQYDCDATSAKQLLSFLEDHNLFSESKAMDCDSYLMNHASKAGEKIGRAVISWSLGLAFQGTPFSLFTAII